MKRKSLYLAGFAIVSLFSPVTADTIYSNLQDLAIPLDFTGVTVTLAGGGTVNPFFGGVGVANNDLFQPVRTGTTNLSSIANLSVGTTIDIGSIYSTANGGAGYGGSQTHLGTTFTAGQEGYLGFKLNGTNFGWMRVVFTGNTAGAVIKDWAYDNSGQSIVVGRVNQSAASGSAQLVTLSPQGSESFTLGSVISDTGGNTNSVLKTGAGTTILGATNTYTGTTTISVGKLVLSNSSAAGTGVISLTGASESHLEIAAAASLTNGITFSNTNAASDITREVAATTAYSVGTSGDLKSSFAGGRPDTIAKILAGTNGATDTTLTMSFTDTALEMVGDSNRRSDIFNISGTSSDAYVLQLVTTGLEADSTLGWKNGTIWDLAVAGNTGTAGSLAGSYSISFADFLSGNGGSFNPTTMLGAYGYDSSAGSLWAVVNHGGSFAAVPEPTSALAGLLITAGVLRRRRAA